MTSSLSHEAVERLRLVPLHPKIVDEWDAWFTPQEMPMPDSRLLSPRTRRVPLSDLLCDHRLISDCLGEALEAEASDQVQQLDAELDRIEAELRSRPEWSAFDGNRLVRRGR